MQHGKAPAVIAGKDQLTTRERQLRPYGLAERLLVPAKPGNSGRSPNRKSINIRPSGPGF